MASAAVPESLDPESSLMLNHPSKLSEVPVASMAAICLLEIVMLFVSLCFASLFFSLCSYLQIRVLQRPLYAFVEWSGWFLFALNITRYLFCGAYAMVCKYQYQIPLFSMGICDFTPFRSGVQSLSFEAVVLACKYLIML